VPSSYQASAGEDSARSPLVNFLDGDLLSLDFTFAHDGADTIASTVDTNHSVDTQLLKTEWFFEVVTQAPAASTPVVDGASRVSVSSLVGICRGVAFTLTDVGAYGSEGSDEGGAGGGGAEDGCGGSCFQLTPLPASAQPALANEPWVRRGYPEWHTLLVDLASTKKYPRAAERTAQSMPNGGVCVGVTKVTSYEAIKAEVLAAPGFWCNGTPPGAPPMTPRQQATLNAGEILSTLAGHRGVVMTQLWAGWDGDDVLECNETLQPVDAPFVTRALQDAAQDAADGAIGIKAAALTGQPASVGLTALIYAVHAPYPERAQALASFGAQAALVAGSSYYQLLVGLILG
jgi:hypothetical protein